MTIVPVAAILVAGIRLRFLDLARSTHRRDLPCRASLRKGEEMGWFEHGSTILMILPQNIGLCDGIADGRMIRAGQRLFKIDHEEPTLVPP